MYQIDFTATNSADWAQAIELLAANGKCGDEPFVPGDAEFHLAVSGRCGSPFLKGSTEDGRITRPKPDVIQWLFERHEMKTLRPGTTYAVGLTMTTTNGTIQLFTGTLSFLDGVVRP